MTACGTGVGGKGIGIGIGGGGAGCDTIHRLCHAVVIAVARIGCGAIPSLIFPNRLLEFLCIIA